MSINPISDQGLQPPVTGMQPAGVAKQSEIKAEGSPQESFTPNGKMPAHLNLDNVPSPVDTTAPVDTAAPGESESADHKRVWLNKTLAGFFIGTTLLGLAGCGKNPPPPPGEEPSSVSTELSYVLISSKDEIELGNQVATQIEKQNPIWNNAEAQQRINRLGEALAKTSVRKDITYTFKLVDSDAINAFALPGGHIYVTRGLYQEFKDDNELSFVMGHEMGHVEARHSIKNLERDAAFRALLRLLMEKKGNLAGVIGEVAQSLANVRFSQKDENQADAMAARHLIRNNVNPWYGVRAMEHLKKMEKQSPDLLQKLFSTHPPTAERVDNLKDIAQSFPQP